MKISRRGFLAGIGALTFFPALGEAKPPGAIGRLLGWHVEKWFGVEGGSISFSQRGNVDVTFTGPLGRKISTRISTREFLRLARGHTDDYTFQDLPRMMDFWNGKVPIRLSDIREAQAAPLWTTDAWATEMRFVDAAVWDEEIGGWRFPQAEPTGARIPKPLFGDTEDQLRYSGPHGGSPVFTTRERVGEDLAQLKPYTDPHNREMIEKTGDVFSFYTEAERVAYREEVERRIAEQREETRRRVRDQLSGA